MMNPISVTLPTIGMIAGTRAALGAGIALLLADRLSAEQRRSAGWVLVGLGALTTIPLLVEVLTQECSSEECSTGAGNRTHEYASSVN